MHTKFGYNTRTWFTCHKHTLNLATIHTYNLLVISTHSISLCMHTPSLATIHTYNLLVIKYTLNFTMYMHTKFAYHTCIQIHSPFAHTKFHYIPDTKFTYHACMQIHPLYTCMYADTKFTHCTCALNFLIICTHIHILNLPVIHILWICSHNTNTH
jgi:hypothetical protein